MIRLSKLICISLMLYFVMGYFGGGVAYASPEIRFSWGMGTSFESSHISSENSVIPVTFVAPELQLGYRFYDQRLGLYFDLSYAYFISEYLDFTKDKDTTHYRHYLSWGILLSYYFRAPKIFSPYISLGLGNAFQWVQKDFHPFDSPLKTSKAKGNIRLIPKLVLGFEWHLVDHFSLGFNTMFVLNMFSRHKGKIVEEIHGTYLNSPVDESVFYSATLLLNIVVNYKFQ